MIDKELIDKIKGSARTFETIQRYSNLDLKKEGKVYSANCPFHNEKTASFKVSPEKNIYKCFGCGASGNAVDFLMNYSNLDFISAIKQLAADEGIEIEGKVPERKLKLIREKVTQEKTLTAAEKETLDKEQAVKLSRMIYHAKQTKKADATAYLRGRGIKTELLPQTAYYASTQYSTKDGKDFPSGVIFFSSDEKLLNKRHIGELNNGIPKSYNKGTLPNSFYTETFRPKSEDVWMVEGVINALSIYQTGRSSVASFATSNVYYDVKAVQSFMKGKRVILAADGDKAGQRYIIKQAKFLLENQKAIGLKSVYAFIFPDQDLDANDLLEASLEEANKDKPCLLNQNLSEEFNFQRLNLQFVLSENKKLESPEYIPDFPDRLVPRWFATNKEIIEKEQKAFITNKEYHTSYHAGLVGWKKGNYSTLLKLKELVKKVIIEDYMTNIYNDNDQEEETDEILCAKYLIRHGLQVYVKPGIDWYNDDDSEDGASFIDFYTRMLATLTPKSDTVMRQRAIERAANFMAYLPKATYTIEYDKVRKRFDLSKGDWNEIIKKPLREAKGKKNARELMKVGVSGEDDEIIDPERYSNANDLPPYVDKGKFIQNGFYKLQNGKGKPVMYMMKTKEDNVAPVSNFTFEIKGHIYSEESSLNKRILSLTDSLGREDYLAVESGVLRSKNEFDKVLYENSAMFFHGSKVQFERILAIESANIPKWFELDILGQQPEGFYAFEDGVYDYVNKQFKPCNQVGTVEFKGNTYYSPTISSLNKLVRNGALEKEGNFRYTKSKTDHQTGFKEWANLMHRTYTMDDAGMFATIFVIMSAYRDFIHRQHKRFPLFFMGGDTNAGKSQIADSIKAPFVGKMKEQNLNSDTDAAFFVLLENYRNCPVVFDEYEENKISPTKFQGLKAAYDGIGKTKKKEAKSKSLDISEVNASVVFLGQYIPEQDDYALFNRSMTIFVKKQQFTQAQGDVFEKLKSLESKGCTNILIEILNRRTLFEQHYYHEQIRVKNELKEELNKRGEKYVERILNTVSEFLATAKIFLEKTDLEFPWTYEQVKEKAWNKILSLSEMIVQSNKVAVFFGTIEYLLTQQKIVDGREFKIAERSDFKIKSKGNIDIKRFEKKKVLFLRMKLIEPHYRDMVKMDALKSNALNIYLNSHPAFLGHAVNEDFKWIEQEQLANPDGTFTPGYVEKVQRNTTAIAFDYDELGVELEKNRFDQMDNSSVQPPVDDDIPF